MAFLKKIRKNCRLVPKLKKQKGKCELCGNPLPPRHTRWCSKKCVNYFWKVVLDNHDWTHARKAAKKHDKKCVECGSDENLEVNHIKPLNGKGYGPSCSHHLQNLQVLCKPHHQVKTNQQRKARKQKKRKSSFLCY